MRKKKNYIFRCQFEAVEEIGAGDLRGLLRVTGGHLLGGALENGSILHSVDAATGAQFVHEVLGIGFLVVDVVRHAERASRLQPTVNNNSAAYSEKYLVGFRHGDGLRSAEISSNSFLSTFFHYGLVTTTQNTNTKHKHTTEHGAAGCFECCPLIGQAG
jgi:hypothetical protein